MSTAKLPFVVRDHAVLEAFREACYNIAFADGDGPVGSCKLQGGSPQWWPRVDAELMCSYPLAHIARESRIRGIVAMGVRWTGCSHGVEMMMDPNSTAALDYVIECILALELEDSFSQKDIAVKCFCLA